MRALALLVVLLVPVAPADAAKPKRPDLTVSALSPAAPTLQAGGQVAVAATIRNAGKKKAGKSVLRAYLGATRLGSTISVPAVKPRKKKRSAGR